MPVFVSYSHEDEAVYSAICLALDCAGIHRWDVSEMSLGESLSEQLKTAIDDCGQCVFIATRRSIVSQWCLAEVGAFWGAGKTVILFLADPDLEESVLPPQFRGNLMANDARRLVKTLEEIEVDSKASFNETTPYKFFATSEDCGSTSDWADLLDNSNESFDIMGFALGSWRRRTKHFKRKILEKAEAGCKVRILCMHPENKLLRNLIYIEGGYELQVQDLKETQYYYQQLANHANIDFRQLLSGVPHFFLTRNDSLAVVIQYLASAAWGGGPCWRIPIGTEFYDIVAGEFDTLWERAFDSTAKT